MSPAPDISVTLDAVIVAVTESTPRFLTVDGALPADRLDATADPTLQKGLRRAISEQAGIDVGYVEQLYTFGDRDRHRGPGRHLSVAYLALVRDVVPRPQAAWLAAYDLLPWEDRRTDDRYVSEHLRPRLAAWAESGPEAETRRERAAMAFGVEDGRWDGIRVLERFELLYEAGLVAEAHADRGAVPAGLPPSTALSGDSRRVLATGLGRLRGKLTYRPVVFELLPETFTLSQLQDVVEALAGERLHKQNFRRLLERGGLVEGTGRLDAATGGRPAELFRFRREVLLERPRPGLGHPSRG